MTTNHGRVCLLYQDSLHAVPVVTAEYQTFEHVAVFLYGQGVKSLFAVIYRPGSSPATSIVIHEFAEFVGQFTRYSSLVIMGDVNIHLDIPTDPVTVNFLTLLSAHNLDRPRWFSRRHIPLVIYLMS